MKLPCPAEVIVIDCVVDSEVDTVVFIVKEMNWQNIPLKPFKQLHAKKVLFSTW